MTRAIELDAQDEAEAEANRVTAARQRADADEQARLDAAEASAVAFRVSEPPDDIAADVAGLSPMRARLVRFCAWIAALEAEHATATEGRANYMKAQRIPEITAAALKKLADEDTTGLVKLMSGNGAISKFQARSHERKLLQERLSRDEYAASVATKSLDAVDAKLDSLASQIEVLRTRHSSFVADCLQELITTGLGEKLNRQAKDLQATEIEVLGCVGALHALRGQAHQPRHQSIALPALPFAVTGIGGSTRPGYVIAGAPVAQSVELTIPAQLAERARWLDLAKQLTNDARADISGKSE